MSFFRIALLENYQKLHFGLEFPEFLNQKKSRKFEGRIRRFLRNYKILQILSKHFILPKKAKAWAQKILQFRVEGQKWNSFFDWSWGPELLIWGDCWSGFRSKAGSGKV